MKYHKLHEPVVDLPNLRTSGSICFIGDLTMTNTDMEPSIHKGLTIGKGKKLYWEMTWHANTGNVTVYSENSRRYLHGYQLIHVHFYNDKFLKP